MVLEKTLPIPALKTPGTIQPRFGLYEIEHIVGHKQGRRIHGPHYFIHPGYVPEADLKHRAHEIQRYQELITAYRAENRLNEIKLPPQSSPAGKMPSHSVKRLSRTGTYKRKEIQAWIQQNKMGLRLGEEWYRPNI